jgi:hypothetical protein
MAQGQWILMASTAKQLCIHLTPVTLVDIAESQELILKTAVIWNVALWSGG